MKNLLLILPLLIVGCATTPTEDLRASGEDFPLKYTCELGNLIMFISFDVDGIATFFYHESNIVNKKNNSGKTRISISGNLNLPEDIDWNNFNPENWLNYVGVFQG